MTRRVVWGDQVFLVCLGELSCTLPLARDDVVSPWTFSQLQRTDGLHDSRWDSVSSSASIAFLMKLTRKDFSHIPAVVLHASPILRR